MQRQSPALIERFRQISMCARRLCRGGPGIELIRLGTISGRTTRHLFDRGCKEC
jgi:hypothetical protein